MTDEGGERFHPPERHSPWWRTLWSREPRGRSDRHIRQEQAFRRELLLALPRLRGHAMALTGAPDRADDLVQDTCERALARWRQYSGEGPLAAWLLRILHNRWHDRLRAEAVRASEPLVEDGSATSVPSSAQDGAESLSGTPPRGPCCWISPMKRLTRWNPVCSSGSGVRCLSPIWADTASPCSGHSYWWSGRSDSPRSSIAIGKAG